MAYGLDLTQFNLARFRQTLETTDLLPGRRILREQIAERFAILESKGLDNLQALIDALSTKKKLVQFAQETGLPEDYLTILRRQARSYIPTPINLKEIPGVNSAHAERLAALGIKHSRHLFERARTRSDRAEVARQANISDEALLELVKLSDLARAGWVGPIFARLLYEAGADTLAALADQSLGDLYRELLAINERQRLTQASFSIKDVEACIETARQLPHEVEY